MVGGHKSEEELQIHEVAHPHHHDYDSFVETTRRGFHLADLDTSGALDPEEFFTYSHPGGGHARVRVQGARRLGGVGAGVRTRV